MVDSGIPTWKTTRLWIELERRDGQQVERLLRATAAALEKADAVLDKADTSPETFTLHDSTHSYQVAEFIAEIADDELLARMGPYDLGLLLLASYLHDIGMTPDASRLNAIFSYLLSGDPQGLPAEETDALQAWLDEEAHGVAPPIYDGPINPPALRKVRSLTAGYARHRHNDWSEDWIRDNLATLDADTYRGCTADLILLCRSHHYGIDDLRSDDFDPRRVGAGPSTVLHLRFDACLLRVADIVDFDPERTPDLIYAYRDIEDRSEIFWHKDHELSFSMDKERLLIYARPSTALIHQAIDLTIEDVDRELQLCQRLAEETQFHRMSGQIEDLPHRWRLAARVHADVKPRNNSYVYVDGTFRPDHERVLNLLGGVALYGSPLAAVRELLQNAFDAVREQIAYQRLEHHEPAASSTKSQIAANFTVTLTLERNEEGLVMRCRDSGSGMSQDIITSRFLVSGSSPSHETRQLERTCANKGFSVERTARFGVGVLAYFLLASKATIHSRRSIQAGDPDGRGWTFVSHGVTDFGELKENPNCGQGTTVEFDIRDDLLTEGADKFAQDLQRYLQRVLRYLPCHFSFTAPDIDVAPFTRGPGWVSADLDLTEKLLYPLVSDRQFTDEELELLPQRRRREIEQRHHRWKEAHSDAKKRLQFTSIEGDLPHGLGRFRHTLGYFLVHGAVVFPYLDISEEADGGVSIRPVEEGHGVDLGAWFSSSWNGMEVDLKVAEDFAHPRSTLEAGLLTEVDWTSNAAGELAVHRGLVTLAEKAMDALLTVREQGQELQERLLHEHAQSPLSLINARAINAEFEPKAEVLWPEHGVAETREDGSCIRLLPLPLPAIDLQGDAVEFSDLRWRGQAVTRVPPMTSKSQGHASRSWHDLQYAPAAVGAIENEGRLRITPIWTELRVSESVHLAASFPPEWSSLIGVEVNPISERFIRVWNPEHPILKAIDKESWDWALDLDDDHFDPLLHEGELLGSPAKMAAWIWNCIHREEEDLWNGVAERSPRFFQTAWESIEGLEGPIIDWYEDLADSGVGIVNPGAWEYLEEPRAHEQLQEHLGAPSADWLL